MTITFICLLGPVASRYILYVFFPQFCFILCFNYVSVSSFSALQTTVKLQF